MAVVSVSADNTRIEDSEATTGWASRGGGAGASAEVPLAYQGTNTVNRKITSSTGAGFEYVPTSDSGTTHDMTAAAKAHWMVKHIVTDANGLRSNDGLRVYIGDGTNEYAFITAGTDAVKNAYDEYLLRTATVIVPVNPNIVGYRDSTHSGTGVSLTAVDLFAIEAEFASPSAKSENVGLDAIDLGTGLTLVGGDGVSADGNWSDFVDEDEGTVNNRWGYANSIYGTSGVIFFFGTMTIGSATATEFAGTGVVLWPDGLFDSGFSGVSADLQSASTVIDDTATHISLGTTNTTNTRADYTWTGTSGTGTASHTLRNFRNYTMTSAVTIDGANIACDDLTQAGGTIDNCIFETNSFAGDGWCSDPDFGEISNTTFNQAGAGHAFQITSGTSLTFDNLTFSGYGGTVGSNLVANSGPNDAAFFNNTGGALTITIDGGSNFSVRNGIGATTTVVTGAVALEVTCIDSVSKAAIQGARVVVLAGAVGPLPFEDSVTITRSGSTATVTHTAHGLSTGSEVVIAGADQSEYNGLHPITSTGANTYTYTVSGTPTTPATGTITSTAVILNALTNASGVASDTRSYASNQDFTGTARKSSVVGNLYVNSPFTGTVDNSTGAALTLSMINDG